MLALAWVLTILPLHAQVSDDEFAGPFPSWSNLRRDYGTGRDALQRALNDLGTAGHPSTLFLSAGTYCFPELSPGSRLGVTIVGEDPGNTVLK